MKKTALCIMALGLSLAFYPLQSNAEAAIAPSSLVVAGPANADRILTRVNEIKEMDKSNLSSAEKKELRKELRSLKKEARSGVNGVYLSVGAIIIIILLLILIL